jgi:secondary thiamine-phosphate synthase enzyme
MFPALAGGLPESGPDAMLFRMSAPHAFELSTRSRTELVPITDEVQDAIRASGVEEGICLVWALHTTVGVIINENADPDVASDVLGWFDRLVQKGDPHFRHAEGNSDAHIKAILAGPSVTIPIHGGRAALGTWQGVYLAEFDGPRRRRISVTCLKEAPGGPEGHKG